MQVVVDAHLERFAGMPMHILALAINANVGMPIRLPIVGNTLMRMPQATLR